MNTTGNTNVEVIYDIMTIRNPHDGATNTRINEVTLQYRIGIAGAWTTLVGMEYQNNTTTQIGVGVTTPQNPQTKTVLLPAACDNQAVVQLRWASRQVSGTGSRPSFAVDNLSVAQSFVTNTTVAFVGATSTVSEGVGTTNLTLAINNFSTIQATTVEVAITAGSAARVNSYTTQTVTFPVNDGTNQTQTITVTDDAVYDGGGAVTFTLQNIAGGQGTPAIAGPSNHVLTITENEPSPLLINELDYDNPGGILNLPDSLEFVELMNTGLIAIDLLGYQIELVNGTGGGAAVYTTIVLPSFSLAPGAYYVVGNDATIPNVNLVTGASTNFIQNGAPDAIGLRDPLNILLDAVSYDGNTGAPYTEGTGIAIIDGDDATDGIGLSRFPNGTDSNDNSVDWSRRCLSPGAANNSTNVFCICESPAATAISQCVDDFTWEIVVSVTSTGSGTTVDITNDVNGIQALNVGVGDTTIGPFANNAFVTITVAHETFSQCNIQLGGFFNNCLPDCNNVIGGPDVPGAPCDDLDPGTENDVWSPLCVCAGNPIQAGVGFILPSSSATEPSIAATIGVEMNIAPVSTVVVDITDAGTGTATSGTDYTAVGTQQLTFLPTDTYPYTQTFNVLITDDGDYEPIETVNLALAVSSGPANAVIATHTIAIISDDAPQLRINEVDYDNAGTDNAEWVELKNTGAAALNIAGFVVQLVNGTPVIPAVYKSIVLPSFVLPAGGYYVIGNNATIPNLNLLQTPATDMIQNGSPDAVALRDPSNNLIDAFSYEGNTGAPYTEGTGTGVATSDDNAIVLKVMARYLDGNDTDDNSIDWRAWCATPGVSNATVDADSDGTADCLDGCPLDANKIAPGVCGCGVADVATTWYTDIDVDGFGDPATGVPGFTCLPPLGSVQDNTDDCPTLFGKNGDACNDNNPFTRAMPIVACACVGTPVPCDNWVLTVNVDGAGSEITWQMIDATSPFVLASGGPYLNNSTNTPTICVPQGACFNLTFTDGGNNGIAGGGWKLVDNFGRRILDNTGNGGCFTTTSTNSEAFCNQPSSTQTVIATDCDRVNWLASNVITASPDAAVSAQYGIGDQTDDGYWFWFTNPCGGYTRKIFRNHATSGGNGPANAVRAAKLKLSTIVTNPLPSGTLLNVRVRTQVNGGVGNWGPACLFEIDPTACTLTQLNNTIGDPNLSCGVTGKVVGASGNTGKIFAKVVTSGGNPATNYRFEFVEVGEGYLRNVVSTNAALLLAQWQSNPLLCGTYTYTVRVQASFDGGATYCPYGVACTVEITNNSIYCTVPFAGGGGDRSVIENMVGFSMYPNPNRGDQLFLNMYDFSTEVNTVTMDMFDIFGKRVMTRTFAVADGQMNQVVDLGSEFAAGLYMVNITAGETVKTERLVIE
ncbi:MAG: lamin tail domain-containing protein [Flavobacteriales bacterium]|nr:lamin tail domain-containing protein [Flavobacteriales bacterium]